MLQQLFCVFEAAEEEECWRQYEALRAGSEHKKRGSATADSVTAGDHCDRTTCKLVVSSPKRHCDQHAHMDDVEELRPRVYNGRDSEQSSSTFWLRKFDAAESADPDRYTAAQSVVFALTIALTMHDCEPQHSSNTVIK